MIFTILGMIAGIIISIGAMYYYIKERADEESRKIYGIALGIGIIIFIVMFLKMIF